MSEQFCNKHELANLIIDLDVVCVGLSSNGDWTNLTRLEKIKVALEKILKLYDLSETA